jgi:uncharacterized secreted protein with C-terminal beta-propeller domain
VTAPTPLRRSWPARAAAVAALAVGAGSLTLLPGGSPTAAAAGLVAWEDCDALLQHYRDQLTEAATPWGVGGGVIAYAGDLTAGAGAVLESAAAPAPAAARTGGAVGTGPTGTNLQESGVDEPDTAKLAGDLVVVSAAGRLQVLRGGAQPELLSSVALGADAHGAELLVDGTRVLAVGTSWRPAPGGPGPDVPVPLPEPVPVEPLPVEPPPVEPLPAPLPVEPAPEPALPLPAEPGPAVDVPAIGSADAPVSAPAAASRPAALPPGGASMPAPGTSVVALTLVDLADPAAPRVLERLEVDGRYVSARLVDGTVRLVTSSSPAVPATGPAEPYGPAQEEAALQANRAAAGRLALDEVLPRAVRRDADGTVLSEGPAVACTDVQRAATAPTGASTLTVTTLRPADGLEALHSTGVTTDGDLVYASPDRLYVATSRWGTVGPAALAADGEATTQVHAFDTTASDRTRYVGSGSVPGYLYGRWALSEHRGDLRVATTLQPPWDGEGTTSSSVVVLREDGDRLVERGRLDGLGVDERIFAVRWFGDLATVVTFRQTDPLYVVDLADPDRPRVLGELKIPGFSTYLHPVGDDRLLGVGSDADADGRVTGFQLSLFDLTDLSRPVQVDRLSLGEGYSPAADDSRAFGYDPARRLAALPFTSYGRSSVTSVALGVRVTEDFRLEEAGRLQVGPSDVQRVLLAGDVLYAVTPVGLVAADPATLARTGAAAFAGVDGAPATEGVSAD